MDPALVSMLEAWLESGTDTQKRHAAARLAMGDETPSAEIDPAYMPPLGDEWSAKIRACPDYNPGCCASPLPYCSRFAINPTRDQCVACLEPPSPCPST